MAQRDALGPAPRRKGKLQVVAAVLLVLGRRAQRLVEHLGVAEEVLRDAQAQAEQRRAAEHVVVGHDAQLGPAVDHGEQREVVVGAGGRLGREGAQGEGREDGGLEQGPVGPGFGRAKDFIAGGVDAGLEALEVAFQHELVELGDGFGVLGDLVAGFGVEDGEAGVDVPFLGVDAQHDVHLDVFEAADVAAEFPGVLGVGMPCFAHG